MRAPMLTDSQRRTLTWGVVLIALVLAASLAVMAVRRAAGALGSVGRATPPTVTQDVVVERLQEVARLVASEMTLRDVITYRQTRYGSTKQMLLVVTARVSAGINLERGTEIRVDSAARRITVSLPPAEIFGVDVVNIRTYDERAGLLNPFRPADRDAIHARIRAQLITSARQSGILEHANQSAARILQELLSQEGYTVDVGRPLRLEQPSR